MLRNILLWTGILCIVVACRSRTEPLNAPEQAPVQSEQSGGAIIADKSPFAAEDTRPINLVNQTKSWKTNWDFRDIEWEDVLSGGVRRDGIPSIDDPSFESITSAVDWLANREPVLTIEVNGDARAYPLGILTRHEIVNDTVGGIPLIATFCPLCNSAIVFDRRVGTDILEFGVSGLLRHSDLIMYDRTTESLWQQFTGEGIVGDLTGTQLIFLPSQLISFADFQAAYPDGIVLSPISIHNTGFNPYTNYDELGNQPFLFQGEPDDRLAPMARVVTIPFDDGIDVAYPVGILREKHVINDKQGDHDIVVFWTEGTASALGAQIIAEAADVGATGVFDPNLNGELLTFSFDGTQIVDDQTGSVWGITGRAISGDLAGEQLTPIIHADHFWFSWAAFRPDTILYER